MSDALAKARAIAAAAAPVWEYRGSIPAALHGRTFDPVTVLAMLDALEAADRMPRDVCWTPDEVNLNEWAFCGRCAPCRLSQALDRVRTLIGDDDE